MFHFAPWSDSQVELMNKLQQSGKVHPYTCGSAKCRSILVAKNEGWICPTCGYCQNWAHEMMANIEFISKILQRPE